MAFDVIVIDQHNMAQFRYGVSRYAGYTNRAASAALIRSEGPVRMTSSNAGVASHTFRSSKLVDEDPIPEVMAVRRKIKRQDPAFVTPRLRDAILAGTETAHGVLGHVRRSRD
jgi:hypothetical protein